MANSKISALTSATTPLAGTETLPIVQSSTTKQVSISNVTAGRTVAMRNAVLTGASAYQDIGAAGDTTYHYSRIIDNGGTGFYTGIDSSTGGFFGAGAYGRVLYSEGAYPLSVYINASKKVEFTTAGNIAITNSGNGIDFSATPGTGISELLNDYEEGTWTPSVGGTATYNAANNGSYTKIGNLVSCQFRLHITLIGTGSTSTITGLPFTSSSLYYEQAGCVGYFEALATNMTFLTFYLPASSTTITFNGLAVFSTSTTAPAAVIGNNTVIFGSISYRI